jgi:hypothetical protein
MAWGDCDTVTNFIPSAEDAMEYQKSLGTLLDVQDVPEFVEV